MTLAELAAEAMGRHRTASDAIADALRRAILTGVLEGGKPLKQDELAAQFNTSHVPVREALRRLEAEDLVVVAPHRGAVVASFTPDEIEEAYDIRQALEILALRRAFPNLTDDDFRRAQAIIEQARAFLGHADQQAQEFDAYWGELNWEFHHMLYAPMRRPRLLNLIHAQHQLVERYLRIATRELRTLPARSATPTGAHLLGNEHLLDEHQHILDACRTGDLEDAVRVLERHVREAGRHLVTYLRERETSTP